MKPLHGVFSLLAACLMGVYLLTPVPTFAQTQVLNLYDKWGAYVGSVSPGSSSDKVHTLSSLAPIRVFYGDRQLDLAAGIYTAIPSDHYPPVPPVPSADSSGFVDITSEALPAEAWEPRDVRVADFNGDGRDDILFTLNRTFCDTLADKRPRILIQNSEGRYIDESEARIPLGRYAADQALTIDVDGDDDVDLFLTGFGCDSSDPSATLLINDGTGVFTDESAGRMPSSNFIYSAAAAPLDSNASVDLLVIDMWADTVTYQPLHPVLWLNDGGGHFRRDTSGRFPAGDYGYLMPTAVDVDDNAKHDIVFANIALCVTSPDGPECLDTLRGDIALYINQGNGFFLDETASRIPTPAVPGDAKQVEAADVDRDGDPDLLQLSIIDQPMCRLLLNDGTGHYHLSTSNGLDTLTGHLNDAVFGTFNGDQYPDVFLTRVYLGGGPARDALFMNRGDGGFADSGSLLPDRLDFSVSATLIDHDVDSDLDIVIANIGDVRLYRNLLHNVTGVDGPTGGIASEFGLMPNFPNPFNPLTTLTYSIPDRALVQVRVTNVLGEEVALLVDEVRPAGTYSVRWDASAQPSGVYYYRVTAGSLSGTGKMIFIR